jgi:hypothetical protein
MTNQQYYDEYVNDTVDTLKQLTNEDIIKLVLMKYASFVRKYDIDRELADRLEMSIVEYHKYMDDWTSISESESL